MLAMSYWMLVTAVVATTFKKYKLYKIHTVFSAQLPYAYWYQFLTKTGHLDYSPAQFIGQKEVMMPSHTLSITRLVTGSLSTQGVCKNM